MYEGVYVRTQDLEPIPIPPGRAMTRPRTDSSTASDPVLEIVVADFEEFFAREYPGLLAMLTALTGHRLPNVAGEFDRLDLRRDNGRRSRRAVDHRGARQSRRLDETGVHRRTRNWIAPPHWDRDRRATA